MFGIPGPTEFDVRFRLLGIPVRIHPLFWAVAALLGWNATEESGKLLLVWVGCVFLSILVHEFGHALTARAFGADPNVLLYSLGGLCIYQNSRETLWRRFFVLAMGPGAGFLLMGATIALASLGYRMSPLNVWHGRFTEKVPELAANAIFFLVAINFYWGIFNLMPVMPLDGGQIATVFLTMHNRREGPRRAYIISLVVSGLATAYFVQEKQYFNALLCGMIALQSFQVLQALHHQSRYGMGREDEADWWRR
jgi:stage IV sporulation protein FB